MVTYKFFGLESFKNLESIGILRYASEGETMEKKERNKGYEYNKMFCSLIGGFEEGNKCILRSMYLKPIKKNCEELGNKIFRRMSNDESMSKLGIMGYANFTIWKLCSIPFENFDKLREKDRNILQNLANLRINNREYWRSLSPKVKKEYVKKTKDAHKKYAKEYYYHPECKEGRKEYQKYPENKDHIKKYMKKYANSSKRKEYYRRPEVKERYKKYYQRFEIKERNKKCLKEWRIKNPERVKKLSRKWWLKNKEKINDRHREKWKEYYAKNKDRIKVNQRMNYTKRKEKAKQQSSMKVDVLPPI